MSATDKKLALKSSVLPTRLRGRTQSPTWPARDPPEKIPKTKFPTLSAVTLKPSTPKPPTQKPKKNTATTKPNTGAMAQALNQGKSADNPDESALVEWQCLSCTGSIQNATAVKESIECETCTGWVHSREMCSGLSRPAFEVVRDNVSLIYRCSACLTKKGTNSSPGIQGSTENPVTSADFAQLAQMVRGCCTGLNNLQQSEISPAPPNSANNHAIAIDNDTLRPVVQDEIHEYFERQKRVNYVIIKGLKPEGTDYNPAVTSLLAEISKSPTPIHCDIKLIERQTSNASKVDNSPKMLRIKLCDGVKRNDLMTKSRKFFETTKSQENFKDVFVSKGLTYAQRKILYNRRLKAREALEKRHPNSLGKERPQSKD